jgi:type II secretory pathway pseudopilin PulG
MLPPTPRSAAQRGFTLVEVLLSAGLLAGVLISISSLFVLGSQNVKSGRELTKATTIANSAVEQVIAWPFEKVYGMAGAASTDTTAVWSTDEANPSWTGTTADVADWQAMAESWRDQVETDLNHGVLTFQVDGVGGLPSDDDLGLDPFASADFVRVRVTVSWEEARGRQRHVTFEQLVL